MLIFRFLHYIWFIDSGKLIILFYFERNNDMVLAFNIAHFPNFEINACL